MRAVLEFVFCFLVLSVWDRKGLCLECSRRQGKGILWQGRFLLVAYSLCVIYWTKLQKQWRRRWHQWRTRVLLQGRWSWECCPTGWARVRCLLAITFTPGVLHIRMHTMVRSFVSHVFRYCWPHMNASIYSYQKICFCPVKTIAEECFPFVCLLLSLGWW